MKVTLAAVALFLVVMTVTADYWDDDDDDVDFSVGHPKPVKHCCKNHECHLTHKCRPGEKAVCKKIFPHGGICKCVKPHPHPHPHPEEFCKKDKDCKPCKHGQWARCLKKPHCDIGKCICEPGPRPGFCKKASDCNKVCPAGSIKRCHKKPHCDIGECQCLHPKLLGGDYDWDD